MQNEESPSAPGRAERAEEIDVAQDTAKGQTQQASRVFRSDAIAINVARSRDGARINVDVMTKTVAGKWWPAARGCSFPVKLLPTIIRALQQAQGGIDA